MSSCASLLTMLSFCVLPFKATSLEATPTDKSYNYYNVAYSPLASVKPPSYKYLTENEIPQTTLFWLNNRESNAMSIASIRKQSWSREKLVQPQKYEHIRMILFLRNFSRPILTQLDISIARSGYVIKLALYCSKLIEQKTWYFMLTVESSF